MKKKIRWNVVAVRIWLKRCVCGVAILYIIFYFSFSSSFAADDGTSIVTVSLYNIITYVHNSQDIQETKEKQKKRRETKRKEKDDDDDRRIYKKE